MGEAIHDANTFFDRDHRFGFGGVGAATRLFALLLGFQLGQQRKKHIGYGLSDELVAVARQRPSEALLGRLVDFGDLFGVVFGA